MASKTTIEIDGNNKGAIVAINGVKSELNSFANDVKKHSSVIGTSMRTIAGYMAGAFSAGALASFVKESVDLASKWQGVNQAFQRLPENQRLLENLRSSVKGTTDDLTLMQYAVRAENFKIPMDALVTGLEFAKIRASETGQSIDYMLDSFVTGMGRQSVKILDNLGISALEISNEFQKTGDFAKAVGNIMERELSKTDRSFTTAKDSSERLTTSVKNFKIEVGQDLIDDLDNASTELANLADGFMDLNTQVKLFSGQGIIGNLVDAISNFNTMGVDLHKITGLDEQVRKFIETQKELKKHTAEVNKVFYQTFGITNQIYPLMVEGNTKVNDGLNKQLNTIKQIRDEYAKLVETQAAGEPQKFAAQASFTPEKVDPTGLADMVPKDVDPFDPLKNFAIDFFDMYDERANNMRQVTESAFGNMSQAANMFYQQGGSRAKTMFAIYKALSIGQAIISTYNAAAAALAPPPLGAGPLFGPILAASTIALGLAQVASIAGTSMGSSGGASGSSNVGGGYSFPGSSINNNNNSGAGNYNQGQNISYNIILQGGHLYDAGKFAREIVPHINTAIADGVS